jgi:chromate transporter
MHAGGRPPVPRDREPESAPVGLRALAGYFLRLGTTGFGGPIALVGFMQRDLVEERRWFTAEEYREGLALAQLAPGPQGAFYGVGAAVIAVIARSAVKLTRLTLGRDALLWCLFAVAAAVTAWTESEVVWVFLGAGMLAMLVRARPVWTARGARSLVVLPPFLVAGLAATPETLWRLGWFFAEAGSFVFGSGLAIVPFLHGGVVNEFHWLDERQFLDAVAVAMITPGPVVITVGFIGYLVAGPAGAVVAALGTFLPCYLFTVIPAPRFKRWSKNRSIRAFVDGVTAAATGAIAGAAFVLGRRALVDVVSVAIAVTSLAVLWRWRKVPEPLLILAAAVAGVLLEHSAR